MIRAGHIVLKLADGCDTRAPAHLDVLDGVKRPAVSVDGAGRIDQVIAAHTSAARCRRCFHAAQSLSHVGARHTCYDETEADLGLDRILSLQIADPQATGDLVQELRALGAVDWARVETLATAPLRATETLSRARPQSLKDAFALVGAAAALEMEAGSRTVPVAVIDTGLALEHPEFTGRLRVGYDTVDLGIGAVSGDVTLVGDSFGRDFCARDETGHGTHVAGIIGARGLGVPPGLAGLSPLIPVRALAAARSGRGGPLFGVGGLADIDAAIKVAVDMGARVLNMSFGTAQSDMDDHGPLPHADVIAYANARGVIPVAAIGNSGEEEAYYPAALEDCIAVGSMSLEGHPSEFSTRGPHIALCAPGEEIRSLGLTGYRTSTGTSHAAPFVAAACALLVARADRRGHRLTTAQAREALCLSARRDHEPDTARGWGMLDVPAALAYLDTMPFPTDQQEAVQ